MKTLVISDELAYKLNTLYEHYDEDKHHWFDENDIEAYAELACEVVEEYAKQKQKED